MTLQLQSPEGVMAKSPNAMLRLGAIVFAMLWTAWMVLGSGSYDLANVVILGVCGSGAGYVWYRAMCGQFWRKDRLAGSDASARASMKP
jgi:hypothetical protein